MKLSIGARVSLRDPELSYEVWEVFRYESPDTYWIRCKEQRMTMVVGYDEVVEI